MKRILLIFYALALIGFYQYGFNQWRASGHTLADSWSTLRQDWIVLLTFVDAGQFTLLVLGWLAFDLRRQTRPGWEKISWFAFTLWLGVPVLLLYVALRRQPRLI